MRERALIHVAGPAGAGKTTFVERLLEAKIALALCVRAEREENLPKALESAPTAHAELCRFRAAGASDVALYRFPRQHLETFYTRRFMEEYSEAVFLEGDCPTDYVDLSVFVAPPLPAERSLLRRVVRDHRAERRTSIDQLAQALESPDAMLRLLGAGLSEPLAVLFEHRSHESCLRLRPETAQPQKNDPGRSEVATKDELSKVLVRCHENGRPARSRFEDDLVLDARGHLRDRVDRVPHLPESLDDGAIDALVRDQVHAAEVSGRTTSFRSTSALKRTAARTPSRVRLGWAWRMSSIDSPAPSFSRISSTVIRVPRTTGFPSITSGSAVIHASIAGSYPGPRRTVHVPRPA
jgi:hypothetical protein